MGGTGQGPRPGESRPEEEECPRRFTANLVDVPQSGNAEYALQLEQGILLKVSADGARVVISHDERELGILPPQYSHVATCIELGWKYTASLASAVGTPVDPTIRVGVVGTPG